MTPVEALASEAAALVAEGGFTGLKLRLGRENVADDLAAIAAVREAAGDSIKLMCDFNQVVEDACRGIDVDGSMEATRQSLGEIGVVRTATETIGDWLPARPKAR